MVNSVLPPVGHPADPEAALALGYAHADVRPRLAALWAFDARLAAILRTTSNPMIGQMRLTWWHDAVDEADGGKGEPVLRALAEAGLAEAGLQRIVEGWEALLDEPDDGSLTAYADGRGGGLFTLAADIMSAKEPVDDAGAGWALIDLARHHSSPAVTAMALGMARERLAAAPLQWSRAGRPLGALTKLGRRDLDGVERQGSPRRVLAAAWLAMTGR